MKTFFKHLTAPEDRVVTLYSPVYESCSDAVLDDKSIWEVLQSPDTLKDFYVSAEQLFQAEPNVTGCFKINLTQTEIISGQTHSNKKSAAKIEDMLLTQTKYEWLLAIEPKQILSYVFKNLSEYPNPYHDESNLDDDPTEISIASLYN